MLLKRSSEVQKDLNLCFIGYLKAFDKVQHSDLFDILAGLNIDIIFRKAQQRQRLNMQDNQQVLTPDPLIKFQKYRLYIYFEFFIYFSCFFETIACF